MNDGKQKMCVVPVELAEANAFVSALHRHHSTVVGHRFSLGVVDGDGLLRGVVVVGRPVARMVNQRAVCEVTRLCTDGTKNACSILYAAAARAAKAMGFSKIQTYILDTEIGTSLKASAWVYEGQTGLPRFNKDRTDGNPRRSDALGIKGRWARYLNDEHPDVHLPDVADVSPQEALAL